MLIGCHFSRVEVVRIGTQVVGEEPITADQPQPVFVREGETYIALLPLAISDLGRNHAMWAGPRGRYLVAEWINYAGEERTFTEDELMAVRTGFAAVVEEANGRDFDAWCEQLTSRAATHDDLRKQEMRDLNFTCGDPRLAASLNHATESVQYATVHGDPVDTPRTGVTV